MNKINNKIRLFKAIAIIQGIIIIAIIVLGAFILYHNKINQSYCETHYSDGEQCLLSARVYTGIVKPESYLILNLEPLKQELVNYINLNKINASIYIVNLRDSANIGINSTQSYEAVSLNKLMVAMIIMKKIENQELTLKTLLPISQEDRDDLSGSLYQTKANLVSVKNLIEYMLSQSDNTAFNVLSKQITIEDGKQMIKYLDFYKNLSFNETIPPTDFQVTPKTVANIFLSLYLSTALSPSDSEMILRFLTNTTYDIKKYAQLPSDVIVAQKFGSFHLMGIDLFHSCGIMYIKDSRVMYCIMTQGLSEEKGQIAVGDIVNKIYNFVLEGRKVQDIAV